MINKRTFLTLLNIPGSACIVMASSTSEDREMQEVQQNASSEDDRSGPLAGGTGNVMSEGDMVLGMKLSTKVLRDTFTRLL